MFQEHNVYGCVIMSIFAVSGLDCNYFVNETS